MLTIDRFASLPVPKETEWDLELPEEQQEINGAVELSEEDAAERDRQNQAQREADERAEFKRRTQVLQRKLPRPSHIDVDALLEAAAQVSDPTEKAIARDTALLIANDARKHPAIESSVQGSSRPLDSFDDDALDRARVEIALEMPSDGRDKWDEDFATRWSEIHKISPGLPSLATYGEDGVDEHRVTSDAFDVRPLLIQIQLQGMLTGSRKSRAQSWQKLRRATSLKRKLLCTTGLSTASQDAATEDGRGIRGS